MKLYFTPQTLKKIIKLLLLFILISIIIFYTKTLNVQALTTSEFDKSSSFLKFTLRDGTSMDNISKQIYFDQPVDFSIYDTKYDNLYLFSTDIIFPEYESFIEYSSVGLSVHFYLTLHFKYFYDITNTNNFSVSHLLNTDYYFGKANIYEDKLYTSISEEGKISYDQFITLEFPYNMINIISSWSNQFHIYTYLDFPEVPNLALTVNLVNAMFTSENATPMSIDEYISNSDENYFPPEELPFENGDNEEKTIFGYIKGIFTKIGSFFIYITRLPLILGEKIVEAFTNAFVPSEDFFKNAWEANFKLLENKLGFLFLPISILEEVLNHFLNLGNGNGIIHIPTIKDPIYSETLISAQDLNLKQIFSTGAIGTAHDVYLIVIDVLIVVGLITLSWKKFNSIFKGGQE